MSPGTFLLESSLLRDDLSRKEFFLFAMVGDHVSLHFSWNPVITDFLESSYYGFPGMQLSVAEGFWE